MTDETSHFIGSQINKMIMDICIHYPSIILEKVSYDMYVPEHWNLSQTKQKLKKLFMNTFY